MVQVVVERHYRSPITFERIAAANARSQWCIAANGGSAMMHALSGDGTRSLCLYEAPDAEAMRRVADTLGGDPPPEIWATTVHSLPPRKADTDLKANEAGRIFALADRRFEEPTDYWDRPQVDGTELCLDIYGVLFLKSYLSLDRKRMLCLYNAPDLEAVRAANRLHTLPVSDVLAVYVPA